MVWQSVRIALVAGVCTAALALVANAGECGAPCGSDCGAPACCAPAFRTVSCTEWRPETYQTTRTVYRTECHQEAYTAYRCEMATEVRTRTCTSYQMVPEVRTEVRNVCVCVPCVETRTVMQQHWTCKPVTCMVTKWEDHGHYECHEVPCRESLCSRLKKRMHHHDCCEECCAPPPMKTVRCWVPCKVAVQVPCTHMERTCEYVPTTCQVTTYKHEVRQESYQVTCCKCVPVTHTENYTVCVPHQVAYQAYRTVAVCVPHQEVVTCTRLVPCTVTKQVPVTECCHEETMCCGHKHRHHH
ncbi:MAG TPA: hypothetical protein VJ739_00750 [Gemmataceae bacterium]|nr:hypothetical protein [Gemmataceae bacterium]